MLQSRLVIATFRGGRFLRCYTNSASETADKPNHQSSCPNVPVPEEQPTYVPRHPCPSKIDESLVEEPPPFDQQLITHLERLSLVRFSNEEAIAHLRKAVKYANQLKLLDTTGIEPMETVLEDLECPLREDVVQQTITKQEVLANAAELVEDYFVTPPGNIPLEESAKLLDMKKVNEWDWLAMNRKQSND